MSYIYCSMILNDNRYAVNSCIETEQHLSHNWRHCVYELFSNLLFLR